MASNFNFTTKLGLDAQGFKQGVNRVRGSVNSLKSSFLSLAGALGAGLGFTQLIANLKATATELSVAQNTLKNVSYVTKGFKDGTKEVNIEVTNFQDNLAFAKKLANDYAQDLVAVTDNYAKFTAACKKTSLSLEDQRLVFEALTKAAAYYHLSADRTKDMMNAVVQMMSKGKVTAEELRRQLGNTLPGAFNMMAAAMGVSNAELDRMMRDGKVITADVLPKFAAMLNSVTSTIKLDSLQASLNKLKNAWYDLVEKSGAENLFKGIVDKSTSALTFVSENMKGIKSAMWGLVSYFASVNLFSFFLKQGEQWRINLEAELKAAKMSMVRFNLEMKKLQQENKITQSANGAMTPLRGANISETSLRHINEYNRALLKSSEAQLKLGMISKTEFDVIQKEVNEATAAVNALNASINATAANTGKAKTALKGLSVFVDKAGKSIANFFKANWVFLLISALVTAFSYLKKIRDEAQRIANIGKDYEMQIEAVKKGTEAEAAKLKNSLEIVKDINQAESTRLLHLKEINKTLGLTGKDAYDLETLDNIKGKYDEITLAVERWIEATRKQAIIQAYANQIAEATAKKSQLAAQKTEKEADRDYWGAQQMAGASLREDVDTYASGKYKEAVDAIENINKEMEQYNSVIAIAEAEMKKYGIELGDFFDILYKDTDGGLSALNSIMDKYNKDTKELANQLAEGAITQEEYNEELNKIVQNAFKAAAATGAISLDEIIKKQDNKKTLSALEKWYLELKQQTIDCARQVLLDGIAKSIIDEIDEALENEAKELEEEFKKILEEEKERGNINLDFAGATNELKYENSRNTRDATFDYKKSRADIFGEQANIANENLDRVGDKIKELLDKEKYLMETYGKGLDGIAKQELESLREYYRELSKNARTIEEAYRFEQIKKDIEDFDKQITQGIFSGIENFATSMDRVVSGAKQLRDLMENVDATAWEKMMGIINYFFNILNAITSVVDTFNTLSELSNMLAGAKVALGQQELAQTALQTEATMAQTAAEQTLAGVKAEQAVTEAAITTAKLAQAEAALGVATALGIETAAWIALSAAAKDAAMAIAAANAAAAAGPAAPAAALAAAASVGAGLTATMAAFAKGGIVGGNSTHGDRNIIRANSGEMILNKAQQGTLFNMLNGKGGLGGNVEFKIRGADLVGTINNYASRKRG